LHETFPPPRTRLPNTTRTASPTNSARSETVINADTRTAPSQPIGECSCFICMHSAWLPIAPRVGFIPTWVQIHPWRTHFAALSSKDKFASARHSGKARMVRPPRTTIQTWFPQLGLGHKSQTNVIMASGIFLFFCCVDLIWLSMEYS